MFETDDVEQLPDESMGTPDGIPVEDAPTGEQLASAEAMGETETDDTSSEEATLDEAAIRAKVEAELQEKHEKDLANLRSIKDKELAEANKRLERIDVEAAQQRQKRVQQADALIERDPKQAAQILRGEVNSYAQSEAMTLARAEWSNWAESQVAGLGLDPTDPEVRQQLGEDVEGLVQAASHSQAAANEAALKWQQTVLQRSQERAVKTAVAEARKQMEEEMGGSVPEQVKKELAKALAQHGLAPDVTGGTPGQPPPKETDYTQMSSQELRRIGRERARQQAREMTRGMSSGG